MIGSATYSTAGQSPAALKVGTVLYSGATIKTAAESSVDLFLGKAAGVVRVTENTTLGIDKLTITDTGADSVIDTQLDLTEGIIRGNVNKLSAASKYEIKLPNGVAGIRGTRYVCTASRGRSKVLLLDGSLVFVHAQPTGALVPHVMTAPPAVEIDTADGGAPKPVSPDVIRIESGKSPDGQQPPPAPPGTPGGNTPGGNNNGTPFVAPDPSKNAKPVEPAISPSQPN